MPPPEGQMCLICGDQATEADYRRELECGFNGCPASEHAYHEVCISEYLRKANYDVNKKKGYLCPAVLSNGRTCPGRIQGTYPKQPVNLKRKQQRVKAATVAAVRKPKPTPAATKAKNARLAAGAGVDTAIRAMGVPVLPSSKVSLPLTPIKFQPVGGSYTAMFKGDALGLAVQYNKAMAPEQAVRQRVVPGWTGPVAGKATKYVSAQEQHRALVAGLNADSGRGNMNWTAAVSPLSTGGMRFTTTAPGGKFALHRGVDPVGTDEADWHCEASGMQLPTLRLSRKSGTLPSRLSAAGGLSPPNTQQDFSMAANDFPGFNCPMPTPFDVPAPKPAVITSVAGEETDPVVAHIPVWANDDDIMMVEDGFGNDVRMNDVYGTSPELIGFKDENGDVAYYVVVRRSFVAAYEAHMEQVAKEQHPRSPGSSTGGEDMVMRCMRGGGGAAVLGNGEMVTMATVTQQGDAEGVQQTAQHPSEDTDLEDLMRLLCV